MSFRKSDPALCQSECQADNKCLAWTYVKPGIQAEGAKCWLKTPAPQKVEDACCVSGVVEKKAVAQDNVSIHALLAEGGSEYDLKGRWDFFPMEGDQPADKSVKGGYDTAFTVTLEPGRYLLRYRKDMVTAETVVEVKEGEKVDRDLILNAGILTVRVVPQEGAEADKSGRYDIEAGGNKGGGYGEGTHVVPAGKVHLKAALGKANAEADIELAAGETAEHTLIAGIGILVVNAVYAEGGPAVEGGEMRVDIFSAKKDLQGKRKSFGGGYGPGDQYKLPPGDYVVAVRIGKAVTEVPATVKGGEMTEVIANVNAGVLAITAPGARRIDVVSAKKDLQGRQENFGGAYGEAFQITLNPGDYTVVVIMGDEAKTKKETAATVKAAERTEITVE